jgi:exodeoxyribonuclease VII small subunit
MSDQISGLSFEDALAELERIVRGLEGGQQKLEDAISSPRRKRVCRPSWRRPTDPSP